MDVYRTEEEQVEALKKWWQENGKSIIFGITLGLAGIFGWRAWQDHRIQQAEVASQLYQEVIIALRDKKDIDGAKEKANQLITEHGTSEYALFAHMILAKMAVDAEDYAVAEEKLQWALDHSAGESMRHLVRLRLARVLATQEKYSEALDLLNRKERGEFTSEYDELRGDILRLQGDFAAARTAYQEALSNRQLTTRQEELSLLEMKLDDLGRTEPQ